jgi:hypothetical protein
MLTLKIPKINNLKYYGNQVINYFNNIYELALNTYLYQYIDKIFDFVYYRIENIKPHNNVKI